MFEILVFMLPCSMSFHLSHKTAWDNEKRETDGYSKKNHDTVIGNTVLPLLLLLLRPLAMVTGFPFSNLLSATRSSTANISCG